VITEITFGAEALLTSGFEKIVTRLKNVPNTIDINNMDDVFDLALDFPLTEKFLHEVQ
jgi:hypothetical protein